MLGAVSTTLRMMLLTPSISWTSGLGWAGERGRSGGLQQRQRRKTLHQSAKSGFKSLGCFETHRLRLFPDRLARPRATPCFRRMQRLPDAICALHRPFRAASRLAESCERSVLPDTRCWHWFSGGREW